MSDGGTKPTSPGRVRAVIGAEPPSLDPHQEGTFANYSNQKLQDVWLAQD